MTANYKSAISSSVTSGSDDGVAPLVAGHNRRGREAGATLKVSSAGVGSQIARSSFSSAAYTLLDPVDGGGQNRYLQSVKLDSSRKLSARHVPIVRKNVVEPHGMFKQLLLSDMGGPIEPAGADELEAIRNHRWTFQGALDLASRSQSDCFFIRCLIEMCQNLQCEEEGDALDKSLVKACKAFVDGQAALGRHGEMYQILGHFLSNAIIFDEWGKFVKDAFEHERGSEESFVVPRLEQVWFRFQRMMPLLEEIFDGLNSRFVWRHRLPKVRELVNESMKSRCFSAKAITSSELLRGLEKSSNETLQTIKRCFKLDE